MSVNDNQITIQYKDGSIVNLQLGKTFGNAAGTVVPHNLLANFKEGSKFKEGDCLVYNSNYFYPDPLNPNEVLWKAGVLAKVALMESSDTLEDSSAISEKMAAKFSTQITKVKEIKLRFDQTVNNLVKEGSKVDPDTVLCIIEDPLTADNQLFDDKSIETLKILANQAPKAKVDGVIDRIEVFYNGDKEDMSENIQRIVGESDRKLSKRNKAARGQAINGSVDNSLRVDGVPLELDQLILKIYITTTVSAGVGD